MWATFVIFNKQPKVNNPPLGDTRPNLGTLVWMEITCLFGFYDDSSNADISNED
jgi:hypothetical protein